MTYTKCYAVKIGKSSAGRLVQIMRPVWCEPGCMKTDDVLYVRQNLKNQSALAVEDVLCAEMADRNSPMRNLNSQVEMEVITYEVENVFLLITSMKSEKMEEKM